MDVTLKNNRLIKAATIFYILLLIVSLSLEISKTAVPAAANYLLILVEGGAYVLMLYYILRLLKHFGENKTLINTFIFFACAEALKVIFAFPIAKTHISEFYRTGLDTLSAVLGMYLMIQILTIKNKFIIGPFKLFGLAVIASVIAFLYIMSVTASSPHPSIAANSDVKGYMDILKVLVPLSVLFLLKNADQALKAEKAEVTPVTA